VNSLNRVVRRLVWSPILWGAGATIAFFVPLHAGVWSNPFVMRYFASHEVEHVATCLFFVGLAALVIKVLRLQEQFKIIKTPLLDAVPRGGQPVVHCDVLLNRLSKQPWSWQESYLVRRLSEALEYVHRKNSAETLDDELRYLSDVDVSRMHASYALPRIIIWAIPILGLLGTVIGITAAVANLSPESLDTSLPHVTAGLGVAFDHTALSLGLSMGLMFVQFFAERIEHHLLAEVDARVAAELVGRFQADAGANADPNVNALRRMAETVMQSSEQLVQRQTELWQSAIGATHQHWQQVMTGAGQKIEGSLTKSLSQSLREHGAALAAAEQAIAEQNRKQWGDMQKALTQSTTAITQQQQELVRQGEVLGKVVEATGQVARLESELNKNLEALSGSHNFEQTVLSLSAAIQLLTGRLGQGSADGSRVDLKAPRSGKAA